MGTQRWVMVDPQRIAGLRWGRKSAPAVRPLTGRRRVRRGASLVGGPRGRRRIGTRWRRSGRAGRLGGIGAGRRCRWGRPRARAVAGRGGGGPGLEERWWAR